MSSAVGGAQVGPDTTDAAKPGTQADQGEAMAVDEDDLLQQALAMSMGSEPMQTESNAAPAVDEQAVTASSSMFDSYDEELQNAIRMSMSEVQPGEAAQPSPSPVSFSSFGHASLMSVIQVWNILLYIRGKPQDLPL